jgi:hypothetical protein
MMVRVALELGFMDDIVILLKIGDCGRHGNFPFARLPESLKAKISAD